jgi:ParB-like chromosome segregation protein Spo0J
MKTGPVSAIPTDRIDESDATYRVTTEIDPADLLKSIAAVGVLNPPVLFPSGDGWAVVAGFRRIAALKSLGGRQVDCRMLPDFCSPLQCARIAIADNVGQRVLNPVELSRAYRLLADRISPSAKLSEEAEALGLPSNPDLIEKVRRLCRLPQPIQEGVVSDRISLSVVGELAQFDERAAEGLALWLLSIPLSLNRQREVLTMVREIARREDRSVMSVLNAPEFASIVEDPRMEPPQKGRMLREALRRRRFPHLARAERDFEKRRKRLALAPGMDIAAPKHFEGGRFELKLSFTSASELAQMGESAGRLSESRALREMLGEGDADLNNPDA